MTDLEILESLRPDVESLSARDRAAMRFDLFGSDTPSAAEHATPGAAPATVRDDLDNRRAVAEDVAAAPPTHPWIGANLRASGGSVRDTRHRPNGRKPHRPVRAFVSVGAAVALVVVGLATVSRVRSTDSPETPPSTPTFTSTPSQDGTVARPTLFPSLPVADPRDGAVGGGYSTSGTDVAAHALIGHVDGDSFTDGLRLDVFADYSPGLFANLDSETVTIDRVDYDVFRENGLRRDGAAVLTTVVRPGTPAVGVSGSDPLGFIEAAGGIPINDETTTDNGDAPFQIAQLPAGYSVVVEPEPLPEQSVVAQINLTTDAKETVFASVYVGNPLPLKGTAGTYHRIDINGTPGWIDADAPTTVVWPLDDDTWVQASADSADPDPLEWARSLEFIDEASWQTRYGFEDPATHNDSAGQPPTPTEPSVPGLNSKGADTTSFDSVAATIIGRSPDVDRGAVQIDRGALDGIRVGMPVIDSAGLVGKVTAMDDHTSIVLLTTSKDFSVAARLVSSAGPTRLVTGTLSGQGSGKPLRFSAPSQQWIIAVALGDLVTTDGGSTSLAPANIPIGAATTVTHPTPNGSDTLEVDVEPSTTVDRSTVNVILYEPSAEHATTRNPPNRKPTTRSRRRVRRRQAADLPLAH